MKRIVPLTLGLLFVLSLITVTAQAGPGRGGRGSGLRANGVDCPERPDFEWVDPDTDGNGLLSEAETAAAIERMVGRRREMIEWRNACVLERFDADGDGQLAGDELERYEAAKERRQQRRQQRREKRENRGGWSRDRR